MYHSFQEYPTPLESNQEIYSAIMSKYNKSKVNTDEGKNNIINIDLHFMNGLHVKTSDYDDKFGLPNTLYITNEDKDKTIKCNIDSFVYSNTYECFFELFKRLNSMNNADAIRLFVLSDFYFIHKGLMRKYNCENITGVLNAVINHNIIYESGFTNWGDLVGYILSTDYFKNISEYINKEKLMSALQYDDGFQLYTGDKSLYYFLDKSINKNQIYCIDLKRLNPSRE